MFFNGTFFLQTFAACLKAVPVTIEITVVSILLSIIPAYGIAYGRIKNHKAVSVPGKIYVSFIRGTPIVLQILVVYSIMPGLLNRMFKAFHSEINVFDTDPIIYAFVVFTLNTIAVMSEVFRSALMTVDKGQYEAALCVGLSPFKAYTRILIPQALVSAMPNLCNLTVNLIKNTSLAFMMTVKDITAVAKIEASYGYNYIEAYTDIFIIYIIVCSAVQLIFKFVEKKINHSGVKKHGAAETFVKGFSITKF